MMNDKIKSLAEKSGIEIKPMIIDDIEYEYEIVEMDGFDDLKKFAELIIRECIEVSNINSQGSERTDDGKVFYYSNDISEQIKQHFGIE